MENVRKVNGSKCDIALLDLCNILDGLTVWTN